MYNVLAGASCLHGVSLIGALSFLYVFYRCLE